MTLLAPCSIPHSVGQVVRESFVSFDVWECVMELAKEVGNNESFVLDSKQ
jgi:hypothetical protein